MEIETASAELKVNNATVRLQRLDEDVMLLKSKNWNVSRSANMTSQDAAIIQSMADEVKQVSKRDQRWPSA